MLLYVRLCSCRFFIVNMKSRDDRALLISASPVVFSCPLVGMLSIFPSENF